MTAGHTHHPSVERLDDYAAQELGWLARRSVGRHLLTCESCRDIGAEISALRRQIQSLPRTTALPPDLWARISAETIQAGGSAEPAAKQGVALADRAATGRRIPVWRIAAVALAAGTVLVVLFTRPAPRSPLTGLDTLATVATDSALTVPGVDAALTALAEAASDLEELGPRLAGEPAFDAMQARIRAQRAELLSGARQWGDAP